MRIIGGGGFAAVWRARTVGPGGFERAVAIKVIRPGRASQKRFQDMLLDEARLVARIQHPNVTQIWEVGEDPRSLYFVMELVEGESLDELRYRAEAAGKTLPIRAVLRVLADVCGGLHVAHELVQDGEPLGLVHRDISPQNILVSHHGIAKLIDFGIAKARERLAGDTTTGFIKGKISFMAPEQGRGEEVDRRADLWAIGAVAYDLIEGRPPFDADGEMGRLAALCGPAPVPPMSDRVPAPLRAVIERTLQKDPAARPPTALALKEAIEEALIESELETSTDDCAELLRPYHHPPPSSITAATGPVVIAGAGAGAQSIERPVSSTIEARPASDRIELPLHRRRYWPLAAGAALVIPLGSWALLRSPPPAEVPSVAAPSVSTTPETAPPAATTPAPPSPSASAPRAPAEPAPPGSLGAGRAGSTPVPSAVPASSSSAPSSAPAHSSTKRGSAPGPGAASNVQKPPLPAVQPTASHPPARPTSKLPDDDAIE